MLQILVIVALIALALAIRQRNRLPATPEAAVTEFFDAAGKGDDKAYLRLTAGRLRESLQNTRSQLGVEAFRRDLERTARGIKGLAVTRSGDAPSDFVALDVEIVFADRNERQRMLLENKGNGWAIAEIQAAEMVKPPIPYGTPVFEDLEEPKDRKPQESEATAPKEPGAAESP